MARFDEEGIEGDGHRSRESIRQVLLEDREVLEALDLSPGEVKENVTVEGVGVNGLPSGTRLHLGDVVLEVTKECGPCSRMEEIREGLQAELQGKRGTLARVITPGSVRVRDPVMVQQLEGTGS